MKKSFKHSLTSILALVLYLVVTPPALSQEDAAPQKAPTTRELVETQLQDLQTRLNLTEYQWTQVEMILKSSIRERLAIAKRFGLSAENPSLDELSSRDKRAMRRELKSSRKFTEDRMERFLSKDQMKEFEVVQEEIHTSMLARLD